MRVLFVPELHTTHDLSGMSTVNVPLSLFRLMSDVFVHAVMPAGSHYAWDEGLLAGIRHEVIEIEAWRHGYVEPGQRFSDTFVRHFARTGGWPAVDIVMANHPFAHAELRQVFGCGKPGARLEIPITSWVSAPPIRLRASWYSRNGAYAPQVALGMALGGTIFFSEYERREMLFEAVKYLSPSLLLKAREQAVNGFGLALSEIRPRRPEYNARRAERKQRNLFTAGSLVGFRRFNRVAEVWRQVRNAGYPDLGLVLCTQSSGRPDWADGVDLCTGVSHAGYLDSLGDGDILLCLSAVEGSATSFFEAAYSGMPAVFKRESWLEAWLPHDYGLVTDSWKALPSLVLAALLEPAWAKCESDKLIAWIEKHMSDIVAADRLHTHCQLLIDRTLDEFKQHVGAGTSMVDLIRRALEPEPVSMPDVLARMQSLSKSGSDFTNGYLASMPWIRAVALTHAGCMDDCQTANPVFVRRTD